MASGLSFSLGPFFALAAILLFFKKIRFLILLLAFLLGAGRVQLYEAALPKDLPYDEFVTLEGVVSAEVDLRLDVQKITLKTEHGLVLLNLHPYEELNFGDLVRVSGQLQRPSNDIEGFNYERYLMRYRVMSVMYDPSFEVLQRGSLGWRSLIYELKERMEQRLNELFLEPEASFAAGLLLGSRKGMPPELADAFQKVGLTHIVAISGYNISLVIAAMFFLLSFLNLKLRVIVSSVAIFLFVILVGASAAVVRAGIMGTLTLWGLFSGRKSQAFFGLLWSGVLMVLMNPYTLVYDVGFQLSFASTLGLLIFNPILDELFPKWKKGEVFREAFLLTLAAQITTLPLILFHFGRLSTVSVLANIFAAPFLPFAMFFSGLALVFGPALVPFAWFHLRMVEWTALLFAKVPYADLAFPISALDFILMNILVLGGASLFYKSKLQRAFGLDLSGVFSRLWRRVSGMHEKQ